MRDPREGIAESTIHAYFEASVAQSPSASAFADGNTSLTYSELDGRANQLAHYLLGAGLRRGDLVGVLLERSIDMVVAVLGISKAGGAYLPLGIEHPPQRLAYMLRDAKARLLVSRRRLASALPQEHSDLVDLDECGAWISAQPSNSPAVDVQEHDSAFCIFTSGSTGQPKGVLVSHCGLGALVAAQHSTYGVTNADRVLQFASFGFDAFLADLLLAFAFGATLVLRRDQTGEALVDFMQRERVTIATLPPSLLVRLSLARVHSLRCLIAAGESCPPSAIGTLPPGCVLFNAYGPTEATIWATAYRVPREASELLTLPIGRPVGATEVLILDGRLMPVQPGKVGEIHLGGPALARGYLGRPDLTAEKFIPHPYGAEGERLYRTGDLARWSPDGDIEFIGRVDHQVKVRGYRIELGEIESVLRRLTDVREAAVIVREHEGHKILVAFVVGNAECGGRALAQELRQVLPDWMVPAQWVFLDSLPLNPNGKIDRQALEAFEDDPPAGCDDRLEGTEMERLLARLWARVLGLKHVARVDGFRSLGGSSIQAIDVAHQVGKLLGLERDAPYPLGNATVVEYADAVESALARHAQTSSATQDDPRAGDVASYAQQQVCFLEKWGEGWRAYRAHAQFVLRGVLQVSALWQAIRGLIQRHAILRTGFAEADGVWRRRVHEEADVDLPIVDLSGDFSEGQLEAVMKREMQFRFNLSAPPLVRWVLLRLAPEHHILLQTEHHNVHDGLSFRVLAGDLAELYSAQVEHRPPSLPEIEGEYADYCLEEQRWLASDAHHRALDAWHSRLTPFAEDLRVFFHAPACRTRQFLGAQRRLALDCALTDRLAGIAAREGVSLYSLMLTAFGLLCSRFSGQTRFLIGSALANRSSPRFSRTVGMFVNMVPVPFAFDERGACFSELLHQVSASVDFALLHGAVPLPEIVKRMGWSRRLGGDAPFNVGFSFHDSLPASPRFSGLNVQVTEALPNGSAKFDLNVTGLLGNGTAAHSIELVFEYDIDKFEVSEIDRFSRGYEALLEAVAEAPALVPCDLPIVDARVNDTWSNGAKTTGRRDICIHELIEEQVSMTPDAVAVVFEDEQLSYAALDARANQLAHCLRKLGVRPGTLVAICVERGVDMIAGLLGVLKAGGAYIPLDPEYPQERLKFILTDSKAQTLVTQERLRSRLPVVDCPVVCLESVASIDIWRTPTNTPLAQSPQSPAYCIYTSGSTGVPKGTLVSHGAIVNLVGDWVRREPVKPSDRFSLWTSIGFDVSVWEWMLPLSQGASLAIPTESTRLDAESFLRWAKRQGVTTAYLPPHVARALPELVSSGIAIPGTLLLGVEPLDEERLCNSLAHSRVVNGYGPTEATVYATTYRDKLQPLDRTLPIGKPIDNTSVYVLDETLKVAPPGAVGEIYIGGDGLAIGYLHRPDLTAQGFIPNPFGEPGSRMYRTGDLARRLPDGNLEFVGRIDNQVKVHGFRIELGEIEAVLLRCSGVRNAVVIARDDNRGEKCLVAYLTPESGASLTASELRTYILDKLPSYMLPSAWVVLDAMPLTSNGKVDRRALANAPTPPIRQVGSLGPSVEHHPPQLTAVLGILGELLPGGPIDANDDLFAKGIHSILIMRFVSRCRQQLGVELRLRDIYRLATPLAIARAILDLQAVAA